MNLDSLPKLRQKQIIHAKYKEFVTDIDNIGVLPKDLKLLLTENNFNLLSIKPLKSFVSSDGFTIKTLFERLSDGLKFESVLMRYKDGRNSVCVSCMIGCPLNCKFCATGKMGFKANLTSDEIVDQVVYWQAFCKVGKQNVTNIVFMGMGEPLLNLDNVLKSIKIISSPDYLDISQKRITISTSGIIQGLNILTNSDYKGDLALSLHQLNQAKRELIMPVAKFNNIDDLLNSVYEFHKKKNTRITFEYILIKGINDSVTDAQELATKLKKFNAFINLIPYNKVSDCDFERPSNNTIFKFKRALEDAGMNVGLRFTMGADENAACGQLTTNYGK